MLRKIIETYNSSKFSRNTAPKVLSLVFALVFWIFVMDKVNPEMIRTIENVHVELLGVQELNTNGFEIMGERDFVVDLKVNGRRSEVINISKNDIQITADLGDLGKGTQSVSLNRTIIGKEVAIVEMSINTVKVIIDENIRKPIDVHIIKQGSVPEGFVEGDMTLSLQQVFVKGPESFVETIDSIRGIVNINNSTTEIDEDIAVSAVDENGEVVTEVEVETNYISVNIPISKLKTVSIEPSIVGAIAPGYVLTNIEVYPGDIEVKGDRDSVNTLKFIETLPVNLTNVDSSFEIQTALSLPDGIILSGTSAEINVLVTIEKILTKEFTFDITDIPFINLNNDLRTNKNELEDVILLRISAVESVLNNLTKSDLALYIDAEEFLPGTTVIKVELNKSSEFNEVEIVPSTIELEVYDVNELAELDVSTTTEDNGN